MHSNIIFEVKDNIGFITLNNKKTLNAWDFAMRSQLILLIRSIQKNKKIRALIFRGAGRKAFCSGQNLNEIDKFDNPKKVASWINQFKTLYKLIKLLQIPTIAAINGVAAGSGFQLALLADIKISHPKAKLGQVEINSGIVSIVGPWIIEKTLGISNAIELSITGKLLSGKEAYRIGAINHLVEQNEVLKKSIEVAKELALKPSNAMSLTKKRLGEMFCKDIETTFKQALIYHKKSFKVVDPQKGSKKFLKKK